MPKKRVKVHYRRYQRGSEPAIEQPLSRAVGAALSHPIGGQAIDDDVELRTFSDPDQGTILLNGRLRTASGDVFGELVRYDPDANIPLLVRSSGSKDELEIREAAKANDTEVLKGMSFFLLRGDHVLVVEQDLSNSSFERYMRWLLCEQTPIAQRKVRLPIIPSVFLSEGSDLLGDISRISVRPEPHTAGDLAFEKLSRLSAHETSPTSVMEILRAANIDTAVVEKLAAQHHARVELNLSVTLKAGRKTLKLSGDDAVRMLRDVPEDELILDGDGVRKNRGRLERLSLEYNIERIGNILDRRDAWHALQDAAVKYRDAGVL